MDNDIRHRPSYAQLTLSLDAGESVRAEAGAMVGYAGDVDVETGAEGGLLKSLSRSVFGGESFFMNTFTANGPSELDLAPALSGDVQHHELTDETLFVQSTSFLASDPSIEVDTKFGGGKTFFGGEGLFLLKLTGTGRLHLQLRRHRRTPRRPRRDTRRRHRPHRRVRGVTRLRRSARRRPQIDAVQRRRAGL